MTGVVVIGHFLLEAQLERLYVHTRKRGEGVHVRESHENTDQPEVDQG